MERCRFAYHSTTRSTWQVEELWADGLDSEIPAATCHQDRDQPQCPVLRRLDTRTSSLADDTCAPPPARGLRRRHIGCARAHSNSGFSHSSPVQPRAAAVTGLCPSAELTIPSAAGGSDCPTISLSHCIPSRRGCGLTCARLSASLEWDPRPPTKPSAGTGSRPRPV
jgi:hypothetical protein